MPWQFFLLVVLWGTFGYAAYEDFEHRGIVWWLFPILVLLFIVWGWPYVTWEEWKWQIGLNMAFLMTQLALVFLYFSWKQKAWANITTHLLGWGDILFMICTALLFCFPNFLAFQVGSLLVVILLALMLPSIQARGIPLAGIQACLLALVISVLYFLDISPFDDSWVMFLVP